MQFSFDEDQKDFAEMVHDFLEQQFPSTKLRDQWENGGNANSDLVKNLAELGVQAATIPEEYEGLGRNGLDLPLALESFGYYGAAETLGLTNGVIAPFLVRYANDEQKQQWLPKIAQGEVLGTVRLSGDETVVGAGYADVFLVIQGDEVHLVPRDQVQVTNIASQDPTLHLGACATDLGEQTLIANDADAAAYVQTLTRSVISSYLIGISQRMLDSARDYALEREQFGRKIGSFQGIKHRMADSAVKIEAARSLSWFAHYCHVHDYNNPVAAAAMAKDAASDAAHATNYSSLQHHGGIGFTWEYDLHMWLQRGYALERLFGTVDELSAELGDYYLNEIYKRETVSQ